jgi:hypothetical protein
MSLGSAGVSSRSRAPSRKNAVRVMPGCLFTYRATRSYTSRGSRSDAKCFHQAIAATMVPHWVTTCGVASSVALRQLLQQCLRLLEVGSVKALGEPVIEGHAHSPQIILSKKWP